MRDNLEQLNTLLAQKYQNDEFAGWKIISDLYVQVLEVNRDRDTAETSNIYRNFIEGRPKKVQVRGLIFVPSKILVGLCFIDKQD